MFVFFVKQKTAYEVRISDWSSTCALPIFAANGVPRAPQFVHSVIEEGVHAHLRLWHQHEQPGARVLGVLAFLEHTLADGDLDVFAGGVRALDRLDGPERVGLARAATLGPQIR